MTNLCVPRRPTATQRARAQHYIATPFDEVSDYFAMTYVMGVHALSRKKLPVVPVFKDHAQREAFNAEAKEKLARMKIKRSLSVLYKTDKYKVAKYLERISRTAESARMDLIGVESARIYIDGHGMAGQHEISSGFGGAGQSATPTDVENMLVRIGLGSVNDIRMRSCWGGAGMHYQPGPDWLERALSGKLAEVCEPQKSFAAELQRRLAKNRGYTGVVRGYLTPLVYPPAKVISGDSKRQKRHFIGGAYLLNDDGVREFCGGVRARDVRVDFPIEAASALEPGIATSNGDFERREYNASQPNEIRAATDGTPTESSLLDNRGESYIVSPFDDVSNFFQVAFARSAHRSSKKKTLPSVIFTDDRQREAFNAEANRMLRQLETDHDSKEVQRPSFAERNGDQNAAASQLLLAMFDISITRDVLAHLERCSRQHNARMDLAGAIDDPKVIVTGGHSSAGVKFIVSHVNREFASTDTIGGILRSMRLPRSSRVQLMTCWSGAGKHFQGSERWVDHWEQGTLAEASDPAGSLAGSVYDNLRRNGDFCGTVRGYATPVSWHPGVTALKGGGTGVHFRALCVEERGNAPYKILGHVRLSEVKVEFPSKAKSDANMT